MEKIDKKIFELVDKINDIEKEKNNVNTNSNQYNGIIYALDYSERNIEIYKIRMTNDMDKIMKINNNQFIHSHKVATFCSIEYSPQFKYFIKGLLYNYRYNGKKHFYICSIKKIREIFKMGKNRLCDINQNNDDIDERINKLGRELFELNKQKIYIQKLLE